MGVSRPIAGVQPFAELFQGATTTVYKGYERSLDRFVLLKVLRPEYGQDEVLVRRFEEEARLVAKVQHPNVVSIYSFGQEGDDTYIIAEFVEGVNLRDLITAGTIPPEIAAFILLQVARGLQAAHARGVFHRDLKPENILISFEGVVKITDFGMASLGEELSEVRGTLGYLAPEQVLGEPFTRASDLFSLGATFFEMLAGRQAFPGADAKQRFDGIVNADPVPFLEANHRIPVAITQICRKLLQKDPQYRYPDAVALATDLETFLRAHAPAIGPATLRGYVESPESYTALDLSSDALTAPSGDGHTSAVSIPTVSYTVVYDPDADAVPAFRRWISSRQYMIRGGVAAVIVVAIALLIISAISGLNDRDRVAAGQFENDSLLAAAASLGIAGSQTDSLLADSLLAGNEPGTTLPRPGDQPRRSGTRRTRTEDERSTTGSMTTGSLSADCNPWCRVYVDGNYIGVTPVNPPLSLDVGLHRVELRHPQLPAYQATVNIRPGEAERLVVDLFDQVAQVHVLSNPWAQVLVDGAVRDTTPALLILAPGRYRLTLRSPGVGTWETFITARAGTADTLRYNLQRLLSQ